MGLILIILSFILTKLIIESVARLLITGGAVRENYLGNNIPLGMGLVIWLAVMPLLIIFIQFTGETIFKLFILTATLLVGLIDDLLGNHQVKGLKGHFLKLITQRELTSGALKAIIISIFSLQFSWLWAENVWQGIFNFLILILTTNSFNLLDLRPGRVLKVYLLIAFFIILFFPNSRLFLSIFLGSLFAYAPWDLKGKGMLGDAGSNFLGMSIAISLVDNLSIWQKPVVLLFLIYLHYYTEKKSLSILIERLAILRLIDNLGRRY